MSEVPGPTCWNIAVEVVQQICAGHTSMSLPRPGAGRIPRSSGGGPVLPSPSSTSLPTGGSTSRSVGLRHAGGCRLRNRPPQRCSRGRHLLNVWGSLLRLHLTDASSLGGGHPLLQHLSPSRTRTNQQVVNLRRRSLVHWRWQRGVPWWRVEERCGTCS